MKSKLLVILALLAVSALTGNGNLNWNSNNCQSQNVSTDWVSVNCPCSSGSGNYDFQYSQLPPGWYASQNKLYIPKGKGGEARNFGAKVSVLDKGNSQSLQRTLLFNFDSNNRLGKIIDTDFTFNHNDQNQLNSFFKNYFTAGFTSSSVYGSNGNSIAFGSAQVQVLPQIITTSSNSQDYTPKNVQANQQFVQPINGPIISGPQFVPGNFVNEQRNDQFVQPINVNRDRDDVRRIDQYQPQIQIIPGQQQLVPQSVSQGAPQFVSQNIRNNDVDDRRNPNAYINNNPFYSAYPSDDQIQNLLSNGDCAGLKNTIGYISQSNFDCYSRIRFLEKLQSKIISHVAIFQTNGDSFKSAITKLQEQKNKIQTQIAKGQYQGGKFDERDFDDIRGQIKDYQSQIDRHNGDRDKYTNEINGHQSHISKCNDQINKHRQNSQYSRGIVEQQTRRAAEIEARITQLQLQLSQLQQSRSVCLTNINKHRQVCDDADVRIRDLNNQISDCNNKISDCQTKFKSCQSNIDDIGKKISGCNGQIKDRQDEWNRFTSNDLQNRLIKIDQQISSKTADANKQIALFTKLQQYQGEFVQLINNHYYSCHQINPSTINNNNDAFDGKYTATNQAFYRYMKDVYGEQPNDNIRARFTGEINIRRNSIYSPAFVKIFGVPYTAGYGSNADVQQNDYSCLIDEKDTNIRAYGGKVDFINKNYMNVIGDKGDKYTVYLGGCTKIEAIGANDLPVKGSDIYFKGINRKGGKQHEYDGYHVTCF